jgi:opacity protein-like surface antigen
MKFTKILPGFFAGVLLALLVTLGIWPALAQSLMDIPVRQTADQIADTDAPVSPLFDTGNFLSVPAAAFGPDGNDPRSYRFVFQGGPLMSGGGGYLVGTIRNYGCMQAPVYFPSQVNVTEMRAELYDNDATKELPIRLFRVNKNTGIREDMAALTSSTQAATPTIVQMITDEIAHSQTDSSLYHYYLATCLPSASTALWSVGFSYVANDLAVSQYTDPMVLLPGTTNFSYRITVNNLGGTSMIGVTLNTVLPGNANITSVTAPAGVSCSRTANVVTCTSGSLNAGASFTVLANMTLPANFEGTLTAQSTVTSISTDDDLSNNVSTLISVLGEPVHLPAVTNNSEFP